MSQHEAFTHLIIELGNTNLLLSDIIEKEKESLKQIKYNNKIPRSLRIKCGLATSPSYANNTEFIKLKDELQEAVSSFIQKGTNIMVEWAEINIQLLKRDRCLSIISKALTLLDGLSSFFLEGVGIPHFPSLPATKYINLFLGKLYLSNQYIEVDNLAEFFDLPLEHIILLGAKILIKTDSEEEAKSALNNLNLSDIDVDNTIHEAFLSETLMSFDQIIKITTIDTWAFHKERNKHTTAAQNLKAKMNSLQIITATEATAHAIAKATENVSITNSKDLTANLRLSTLEKQVRKQDQKFNEKFKTLQQQKNSNGSYPTGSVASPDHLQTRTSQKIQINQKNQKSKNTTNNQNIIDLSNEEIEEGNIRQKPQSHTFPSHNKPSQKRQRKQGTHTQQLSKKRKLCIGRTKGHSTPGKCTLTPTQYFQSTHNTFTPPYHRTIFKKFPLYSSQLPRLTLFNR